MQQYLKITWNASLTAFVVTLLAGLFFLAMPPTYRATATITGAADNLMQFRSAALLQAVVDETGVDPVYLESWSDQLLDREGSAVNLLKQRLSVDSDRENDWVEISVEAGDPDIAASLANAIARQFLRRTAASGPPGGERSDLAESLALADERIVTFRAAHPDVRNPAALEASLERRASDLEKRLQTLESELVTAETELAIISAGDLAPLSKDAEARRALSKREQLLGRKAELSARYGARHQKMQTLESELDGVEHQIEDLTVRAANRASLTRDKLRERLSALEADLQAVESERLAFDRIRNELNDLLTARDRLDLQLRGGAAEIDPSRYSAAIVPDSSLGFGQVRLLVLVFAVVFLVIASIQLLVPGRKQ